MATIKILGKNYKLDDEGYLINSRKWTKEWAGERAKTLGIEVTYEHWLMIDTVRHYYITYGVLPILKTFCRRMEVTQDRMIEMFGPKPMQNLSRIAGLERPPGCV